MAQGGQALADAGDAQRPFAPCQQCHQILPMDAYDYVQWELIRANRPGFCMACKSGAAASKRGKLDPNSLEKYECAGCSTEKIAAAFPRAQLLQKDADILRRCLNCLQTRRAQMQCCRCQAAKEQPNFEPQMVTMPPDAILCLTCQEDIRQPKHRPPGFFTCRSCQKTFPVSTSQGVSRRYCLNCGARENRKPGTQTCKGCKRKWEEARPKGDKRLRYCVDCRKP